MKIVNIVIGIVAVIIVIVLISAGSVAFIVMDMMSYTATGAQDLSPAGTVAGNAIVVYDPGVSGSAKNAAGIIADDLNAKGYKVKLAGVRSVAASNVSGYDVIVVGGPTYVGNISGSVKSYLSGLKPSPNAKVGVFATGSVAPSGNGQDYMRKFVTGLPDDGPLKIDEAAKIVASRDAKKQCDEFVAALLE